MADFSIEPWAGFVFWWSVQGNITLYTTRKGLAKFITVILQMRLYALYQCSKRILVFMAICFLAEVGAIMWILISSNLLTRGTFISFSLIVIHNICWLLRQGKYPWFIFHFRDIRRLIFVLGRFLMRSRRSGSLASFSKLRCVCLLFMQGSHPGGNNHGGH